ncbi:EndoU domain-containing protein [Paenibacillus sp. P96]|uniref:EndoU domain-containing protein n=1 Tax=Paenibacillus zeirhizosphaerae TaxID=2987519 RepID=A0ABT9FRN1_9BACL|nr:EndoU domain-containing protein [Paenibacillus sp. P96]MDP4097329.1 EndoU domain-containing protein [Paenibacillus sp. P96]
MGKIQIPADLMMEVARRIRVGKDQLKYILEQNFSRTTALLNEFEGETARRFRSLHEENARTLSLVPANLQRAAEELESIVNKFVDADSGIVHIPDLIGTKSIYDYAGDFFKPDFGTIGPAHTGFAPLNELSNVRNDSTERPPREEPEKGFGDHVHDFFEGAWKPLSTLNDNIVKLGEQIEEDPVGTIGGMARDTIAAPVEGAVNGATFGWNFLWGTGGAREQAKEYIETEKQQFEEQGAAFYTGTAASTLAVQFLGRRVGIKGRLGDGGKYTLGGEDQDKLKDKISEGMGNAVPVIKNNFEFVNGFDDHMINAQGIVRKGNKGVVGGHNLENFEKILTDQGWKLDDIMISRTPHPTVPGVYQVQYRLPALDRELNVIPGQYKNIPHPKTVYDPNVISNDQMIKWGKEATEHGEIVGREIRGTASNGLKFTGYLDENGKVTNFFPTISE